MLSLPPLRRRQLLPRRSVLRRCAKPRRHRGHARGHVDTPRGLSSLTPLGITGPVISLPPPSRTCKAMGPHRHPWGHIHTTQCTPTPTPSRLAPLAHHYCRRREDTPTLDTPHCAAHLWSVSSRLSRPWHRLCRCQLRHCREYARGCAPTDACTAQRTLTHPRRLVSHTTLLPLLTHPRRSGQCRHAPSRLAALRSSSSLYFCHARGHADFPHNTSKSLDNIQAFAQHLQTYGRYDRFFINVKPLITSQVFRAIFNLALQLANSSSYPLKIIPIVTK